MSSALQDDNFIVLNVVHKPVGFVYSSAPTPLIIVLVLQWLGFSYAIITVTVNVFKQLVDSL